MVEGAAVFATPVSLVPEYSQCAADPEISSKVRSNQRILQAQVLQAVGMLAEHSDGVSFK